MNVLHGVSRLKCASSIINNIAQGARGYAVSKKLPIKWVRPRKQSCISKAVSGDGGLKYDISPNNYIKDIEDCASELQNADDIVKKMFRLEFQRRRELVQLQRSRAIDLVKRHNYDTKSMETQIAIITAEILQLQERQNKNPYDSKNKVFLKELIDKRKKWLKKLRIQDYARFEFILERLNLVYHPVPEDNSIIARKDSTKKLLNKYCDEMIQKRLDEYQAELEAQQKSFFIEKAEKLEFMRNEEIACGVTPTISEEEIEAAKQKAATFV